MLCTIFYVFLSAEFNAAKMKSLSCPKTQKNHIYHYPYAHFNLFRVKNGQMRLPQILEAIEEYSKNILMHFNTSIIK